MNRKEYLSENDLRIDNTNQFIKDIYQENSKEFYSDFKKNLINKLKYTEENSETKVKQIRNALGRYKGKSFTKTLQNIVEKSFDLPINILSQIRPKKFPAYILVSCTGKSANLIFSEIKNNNIVDEVTLLFGDIDVLIKVYATSEQVKKLVTEDLFRINDTKIYGTKTYFPLDGKYWIKHPIGEHPNYSAPSDRWYS